MEISPRLAFIEKNLDMDTLFREPNSSLELYQYHLLNSQETLSVFLKSRQIGFSFACAIDAVAHAHLVPNSTCCFISINRDEASNKIRYTNWVWEALNPKKRLHRKINNRHEVGFTNGSRILSLPAKAPRGFSQMRIYLDELGFIEEDYTIYDGLIPVITRGGTICAGSTPNGSSGLFYDIWSNRGGKYNTFQRYAVPWYYSTALCVNPENAMANVHTMHTRKHVDLYGTPQLKVIFRNTPMNTFRQEYCCVFVDEATAWISEDEIHRAQESDILGELHYVQAEIDEDFDWGQIYDLFFQLDKYIQMGLVRGGLYGGMDVGRSGHGTELIFAWEEANRARIAFHLTMRGVKFRDQQMIVQEFLTRFPVVGFAIDRGGIGMETAERLLDQFGWIEGIDFSWKAKQDMAVRAKVFFQESKIDIPDDRNWYDQIHELARKVRAGSVSFVSFKSQKRHHNDIFWAVCMMLKTFDEPNSLVVAKSPLARYRG